jgi:hypothetical protein
MKKSKGKIINQNGKNFLLKFSFCSLLLLLPSKILASIVINEIARMKTENFLKADQIYIGPLKNSGIPRAENSVFQSFAQSLEPETPAGIIFNEILPSPKGPDSKEWIEIKNQNEKEVDLSGWQIKDEVGKITIFTFPKGTKISPKGFLVLSRKTSKIVLNNSGDTLKLFCQNKKLVDSLTYPRAIEGQSYNLTKNGWFWSKVLTPGSENIIAFSAFKNKEAKLSKNKKSQIDGTKRKKEKELATIGEQFPQSSNFPTILLIALSLAIFSGVIILVLKKKIKKKKESEAKINPLKLVAILLLLIFPSSLSSQ